MASSWSLAPDLSLADRDDCSLRSFLRKAGTFDKSSGDLRWSATRLDVEPAVACAGSGEVAPADGEDAMVLRKGGWLHVSRFLLVRVLLL